MHEVAVLTIWFSTNIAAMMLTMFLPHIFLDESRNQHKQERLVSVLSEEGVQKQGVSEVWIEEAA